MFYVSDVVEMSWSFLWHWHYVSFGSVGMWSCNRKQDFHTFVMCLHTIVFQFVQHEKFDMTRDLLIAEVLCSESSVEKRGKSMCKVIVYYHYYKLQDCHVLQSTMFNPMRVRSHNMTVRKWIYFNSTPPFALQLSSDNILLFRFPCNRKMY